MKTLRLITASARSRRMLAAVPVGVAAILTASPAFAHHLMGGALPQTFVQGLLSGLGHPVIGIDHLAFVIAVGIASAFLANRWLPPLAFVAATAVGCLLTLGGVVLPLVEIVVTLSVVLIGSVVLSGRAIPAVPLIAVFALAGLFHGNAYGQSIVGAETSPLLAYLIGFSAVQYGIASGAGWLVGRIRSVDAQPVVAPRLVGAVAAGIGFALLIENVEAMLFA